MTLPRLVLIILLLFSFFTSRAGAHQIDSLPGFSFINYNANQLLLPDSSTLQDFFEMLWKFEQTRKGKVKILHIGDSHVQGGFWTQTVRKNFHELWSCGTQERGFVFPYALAQSNSVKNLSVTYTGLWQGCRSAFIEQDCKWGLAGFSASSSDDTLSFKVSSKAFDQELYRFNEFTLYAEFDSAMYNLELLPFKKDSILLINRIGYLPSAKGIKFYFSELVDSIQVKFNRKNFEFPKIKDTVRVYGVALNNHLPGITYTEAAVNGGKVASFLASEYFLPQLIEEDPDLIVLSLGTNDAYSSLYSDSAFVLHYEQLLLQITKQLPYTAIILTTPGDAKRYQGTTIQENIQLRKIILKLAQKYNCAVWDWFQVMGGLGSVEKWKQQKLAAYDQVHLTDAGYQLQGNLFYSSIIQQYEDYTQPRRKKELILNNGKNWKQFWEQFYLYHPDQPIHFTSSVFWILFFVIFLIYSLITEKIRLRTGYLFLVSLFLYYLSGGYYFTLLLASTFLDYFVGNQIAKQVTKGKRLLLLWVSIGINLSLLGFFKYDELVINLLNDTLGTSFKVTNYFALLSNHFFSTSYDLSTIVLPVGISFYTFQTMSYSIDVYRKRIEPLKSIVDFGFYVSFFPQLVAGPIVRANEFIDQIHQKHQLTQQQFIRAGFLILGGLIKKIVISDYVAVNLVDRIFDSPLRYSGFENLLAAYGYTLQIYCDFSAYSDIAIGLALLLGFTLPENFRAPYLAENITDFWRRWHMSLSRWLKDYLYISIGGNRKGRIRTQINLLLTMLIGGLWHGASLKFVYWGGIHGLGLVGHKLFMFFFPKISNSKSIILRVLAWSFTFHFVVYCWLFFRAPSLEVYQEIILQISNTIFDWRAGQWVNWQHYLEVIKGFKAAVAMMLMGYLLHLFPFKWEEVLQEKFARIPFWFYPLFVVGVLLLIYQFHSPSLQPFIYFQF